MNPENITQNYKTRWILDVLKLKKHRDAKKTKNTLSIGVCNRTGNVSFVALYDPVHRVSLEPLKDSVVIESGTCKDAAFCLNLDCSLNQALHKNFKRYGVNSANGLAMFHNKIEREKIVIEKRINLLELKK